MSEEKYTRCPACKTIFRVTSQQLAIRAGQVRCGHCQAVFDGNAELLPLVPATRPAGDSYDDATLGPATMTLRMPQPATAGPPVNYQERFSRTQKQRQRRRSATV